MRLISEEGKQLGIVALPEALKTAQGLGVDLVEIAPNANPPVCRLVDYKKFKYELAKKERDGKKHAKEVGLKEVRLGPFIGEHDLNVRLNQIRSFLSEGDRVKVNVRFSGRQMAHPEFGITLTQKVVGELGDLAWVERDSHFEGRQYITILLPRKGIKNAEDEDQKKHTETN